MTDLIGCKLTHYSLSGVLFESWQATFTGVVRCVEPDGSSVLLEITEVHDKSHPLEPGSLLRVGVMAGSKERLSTVQPPIVAAAKPVSEAEAGAGEPS